MKRSEFTTRAGLPTEGGPYVPARSSDPRASWWRRARGADLAFDGSAQAAGLADAQAAARVGSEVVFSLLKRLGSP